MRPVSRVPRPHRVVGCREGYVLVRRRSRRRQQGGFGRDLLWNEISGEPAGIMVEYLPM